MKRPSDEYLAKLRAEYPKGTRVQLIEMIDEQAPPPGTKGTVRCVDDMGSLIISWDNRCGLNLIPEEDKFTKLESVTTICYGKKEVWDSRRDAAEYFLRAISETEGSECERYTKIYAELLKGNAVCTDE